MELTKEVDRADHVDRRPVHVDRRAQVQDKVGKVRGDPVLRSAVDADWQGGRRGSCAQCRSHSRHHVAEVRDGVAASSEEEEGRVEDQPVQQVATDDGKQQRTDVAAHLRQIQVRRTSEDQRPHADGSDADEARDHLDHNVLQLAHQAHGVALAPVFLLALHQQAKDDGADDNREQIVLRGVVDHILRHQVVDHGHDRVEQAHLRHNALGRHYLVSEWLHNRA
mmetsp:Transcript_57756/g.148578  ORF Transcript_57756/g.148578 Transcript_57756/m.148578 type:complete len:223 (+) Transcript_57756:955-1623(+)